MAIKRFVCILTYSESVRLVFYFKLKVVLAVEKKRLEKLGFLKSCRRIAVCSDVRKLPGALPQ
jgi:hypothetical protein